MDVEWCQKRASNFNLKTDGTPCLLKKKMLQIMKLQLRMAVPIKLKFHKPVELDNTIEVAFTRLISRKAAEGLIC